MKTTGATVDYAEERIAALMKAYDSFIDNARYISMPQLYAAIVEMPTHRFWVSEIRATKVICSMLKGRPLRRMRPLRKEMFNEIFNRVKLMKQSHPRRSIRECCAIVVSQPAPKFYLTPGTAKVMICKARGDWQQQKIEQVRQRATYLTPC